MPEVAAVGALPAPQPAPAGPPALTVEARGVLVSVDRLLVGTVLAGTLSVRVVTALLLALGPLFIGCLLFDATRGLFAGWVRVLVGTALAGVAAALVIALELAVIEPQLVALRGLRDSGQPPGQLPQDMLATCGCFAVVMLAALIALARTASAFRLPAGALPKVEHVPAPREMATPASHAFARIGVPRPEPGQRGRVEQLADAARALELRDARTGRSGAAAVPALVAHEPAGRLKQVILSQSLGQSGRRTSRRISPTADRRDDGR
jgi:type IV secretion system protein VirB6